MPMLSELAPNVVANLISSVILGKTVLSDDVVKSLRTIYFTPDGVLELLKKICDDKEINDDEVTKILTDFNDSEDLVRRSAEMLSRHNLEGNYGISLKAMKQIEMIKWGKLSIRRDVQEAINHFGQPESGIRKRVLKKLIDRIYELNEKIEALEEAVNLRAK